MSVALVYALVAFAVICVCALLVKLLMYCNSVLLTLPSASFAASIPVAIFASVTFASAILAVVTLAFKIFAVVILASFILAVYTASLAKSPTTIVPSAIIELTTLLAPIVVASPPPEVVTSPVSAPGV